MTRRGIAWVVLAAVLTSLLALHPSGPVAGQGGPIKIGLLVPLSGAFSATGKDMLNGAELYLDEIGRQAAGRRIELIVEDTEGTPATALTKARKLVDQDRVHVLTGGLLASTGYALQPYVDGQRIPTTFPVIAADDLTQRKPARWIVRTGWTTSQPMHPFGDWVARTLKYRRVVTIGMDYAFGWETVGGFQRSFEEAGGQVVQKIWTPLNTNDFAPFLAQIRRDADAVLALFVGRLALQFMKQYEEAGLKAKLPLLGGGTTTDESVLPQMGDEALGAVTALHYSAALDNPHNQKFARAFEARAGKSASYYSEATYTGTRWIVEAIKADLATGTTLDLTEWWAYLDGIRRTYPLSYDRPSDGALSPEYVIQAVGKLAGPDAIYCAGVGQHQMWAAQFVNYEKPRTWLNSGGLGTMGYA
ncbi:MAG: ABC transporter substrate-binding protein, partial [Candidatus Rokubacteria bacterium]|nr:ABC transporter substrate-binding protein [Candidatus Rokubacteria bacterium]